MWCTSLTPRISNDSNKYIFLLFRHVGYGFEIYLKWGIDQW
jgi:hypothetical protein